MPTWRSVPCSGCSTSVTASSAAQRGVGERLFRSAHRLERHPGLGRDADPLVAREACDRLRHLREVVRKDDQVLRVRRHAVGVVANSVDVAPQRQRVAVRAREHEFRVRDPLFDPAIIRAVEEALRRTWSVIHER